MKQNLKSQRNNEQNTLKQQYSQVLTLKSIDNEEEPLEIVSKYSTKLSQNQNRTGIWSKKEHIKYIMFLDYFSDLFSIKHNKKLWKIFTIMSSFIKTRNSTQCRSHHQKAQRKCKTIQQILKLQKPKVPHYQEYFHQMKAVLQKLSLRNPQIISKQVETSVFPPSVKCLQDDLEYRTFKSLIYQKQSEKQQQFKIQKSLFVPRTEKCIKFQKGEKQIRSECSIKIEDQGYQSKKHAISNLLQFQQKQKKNIKQGNCSNLNQQNECAFKNSSYNKKTTDSNLSEHYHSSHSIAKLRKIRSEEPNPYQIQQDHIIENIGCRSLPPLQNLEQEFKQKSKELSIFLSPQSQNRVHFTNFVSSIGQQSFDAKNTESYQEKIQNIFFSGTQNIYEKQLARKYTCSNFQVNQQQKKETLHKLSPQGVQINTQKYYRNNYFNFYVPCTQQNIQIPNQSKFLPSDSYIHSKVSYLGSPFLINYFNWIQFYIRYYLWKSYMQNLGQ